MFVEVDHLRALLEADNDAEIGALAAAERDRLLDVIGDARTLLRRVKDDAYRERPLAEDRLIGAGDGDEILEIHRIGLRGRAAFADDDDVGERPQDHRARTRLGRLRRREGRKPTAARDGEEADQHRARRSPQAPHRLSCVPSQNGLPPVDLQPQSHTSSVASAVNGTGVSPVPWCEPSQKGWLALRPQAHQKYLLPASTVTP